MNLLYLQEENGSAKGTYNVKSQSTRNLTNIIKIFLLLAGLYPIFNADFLAHFYGR
jgi:hypothetical protein